MGDDIKVQLFSFLFPLSIFWTIRLTISMYYFYKENYHVLEYFKLQVPPTLWK